MTACSSHFKGTINALLTAHVGKVELIMLLLGKKLLACVDNRGGIQVSAVEELDNVEQGVHAIDLQLVDNGCLAHVLAWHDETFELLCARLDGDGQGATDGEQTAIEAQLAHEHVFTECVAGNLTVGGQDANG